MEGEGHHGADPGDATQRDIVGHALAQYDLCAGRDGGAGGRGAAVDCPGVGDGCAGGREHSPPVTGDEGTRGREGGESAAALSGWLSRPCGLWVLK